MRTVFACSKVYSTQYTYPRIIHTLELIVILIIMSLGTTSLCLLVGRSLGPYRQQGGVHLAILSTVAFSQLWRMVLLQLGKRGAEVIAMSYPRLTSRKIVKSVPML